MSVVVLHRCFRVFTEVGSGAKSMASDTQRLLCLEGFAFCLSSLLCRSHWANSRLMRTLYIIHLWRGDSSKTIELYSTVVHVILCGRQPSEVIASCIVCFYNIYILSAGLYNFSIVL